MGPFSRVGFLKQLVGATVQPVRVAGHDMASMPVEGGVGQVQQFRVLVLLQVVKIKNKKK